MQQLLAAGADPTVAADGGATPLHAAAEAGQLDTVLLLLEVLANISGTSSTRCPSAGIPTTNIVPQR